MTPRKPRPASKPSRTPSRRAAASRQRQSGTGEAAATSTPHLVVGIGASVGGLDAFKAFFANMPADSGMAFILIQHLAPDHRSIMAELVGTSTAMEVLEAGDGMAIAANRVFVIPPNATMTMADGHLHVVKPAPERAHRRPIDSFMFSLAKSHGETAVCVILSGSGSDGAQGLAAIKEHGGITLAQAELDETAMAGMPSSAAATGLVDHVLPVDEMPAKLIEYQGHLSRVKRRKGTDGTRQDAREYLDEVCALLDKGVGHDFRQYKDGTMLRRIQRRMQIRQLDDVAEYIGLLRKEPREVELLFRDLLIGVTHFFRDPAAFEALAAAVISKLVKRQPPEDQIRVWVPGCATGEEAYSIAILLQEAAAKLRVTPRFVIFATDINDTAVAIARGARYHQLRMDGLSAERLRRWFVKDGEYYRPITDIREMCIFSVHSLVRDPPFSKLHLISCRNVLIYLDSEAQNRVARLFHYGLRPRGYLFLGPSESVSQHGKFFTVLNKKRCLLQRNDGVASILPNFSSAGLSSIERAELTSPRHAPDPEALFDRGARRVMKKYSPAYIVIDRQHQIVRFAGQTGQYLEPAEGAPSFNLFNLLQSALRPAVRTALRDAAGTQQEVTHRNIPIEVGGTSRAVTVIVEPILQASGAADHYVIAFRESPLDEAGGRVPAAAGHPSTRRLEKELAATRARLQAAIDEAERANEELRSSNEEYRSANEEVQSANEELEASKEELQSMNEELQTLNSELSRKNSSLVETNSDLQNFLESSQIATLFLGEDLRVRNFTPQATTIFHLRDADRGRPITEITSRLAYASLPEDVESCLRSLAVVERDVAQQGAATYTMRIRPYRTVDGVVAGVVITFVDVTESKRHEAGLARLAAIVESSRDAMIGLTSDGVITSWNVGAARMFGYADKEAVGQSILFLAPKQPEKMQDLLKKIPVNKRIENFETTLVTKDGNSLGISLAISPLRDRADQIVGVSLVARDMTERLDAERLQYLLMAELDHRVKNTLAAVQAIAKQTGRHSASIDDFHRTFDARLMALSKTHSLLAQERWKKASLRRIVEAELAAHAGNGNGGPRVEIAGDDVALDPKQALAFGLALHELATNAVKYGALSVRKAQVKISWKVSRSDNKPTLRLEWIETGGPKVKTPGKRGFGSKLIERGLRTDLGADVRLEFHPEGVRCFVRIPLTPERTRP